MPKNLTKDEEIDEVLDELRKAYKANSKAQANLIKNQLEVKRTHNQILNAGERLRGLTRDSFYPIINPTHRDNDGE